PSSRRVGQGCAASAGPPLVAAGDCGGPALASLAGPTLRSSAQNPSRLKVPIQRLPVAAIAQPHVVVHVDLIADHAHRPVAQQAIEAARMRAAEDENSVVATVPSRRKADLIVVARQAVVGRPGVIVVP